MWKNEEDLKNHLKSREYGKLLLVLEMALENPEIRFSSITGWSGIETIENARRAPNPTNGGTVPRT